MSNSVTQFKRIAFLSADADVQGHIHAGLRSAPLHNKRYVKWYKNRLTELQDIRGDAREEWRKVAPPEQPYRDRMIAAANGHPDLSSTQAARRICNKKGITWEI